MEDVGIYEVNERYVDYLAPLAPHLFHNKRHGQKFSRKYIGVVLTVNDMDYFAPLSSFKDKHRKMKEGLDLIKLKDYAVINLNCMFPVPENQCTYVDISKVEDPSYRSLLRAEYREIRALSGRIRKNARNLYQHKIKNGTSTRLAARCNDFTVLETACKEFM